MPSNFKNQQVLCKFNISQSRLGSFGNSLPSKSQSNDHVMHDTKPKPSSSQKSAICQPASYVPINSPCKGIVSYPYYLAAGQTDKTLINRVNIYLGGSLGKGFMYVESSSPACSSSLKRMICQK